VLAKREGELGTQLGQILRSRNAMFIPMVASEYSERGVPDKFLAHRFWQGWCELKNLGEKLPDHQAQYIANLAAHGCNCCVIWFTNRDKVTRETQLEVQHVCYGLDGQLVQHTFTCTAFALIDVLAGCVRKAYGQG
jgi:hypothetical protein